MADKETQFQPGDIVRLKSGSPKLTVTGYVENNCVMAAFWNADKCEFSEISGADARKAAALAEVQRLSDLLKQTLAAAPQWRRGGGNYRPY